MNEKGKHEMLHFYRYVEAELNRITAVSELYFTDESLRIMKRIYRKLRLQIMKVELALIHRKSRWEESHRNRPEVSWQRSRKNGVKCDFLYTL